MSGVVYAGALAPESIRIMVPAGDSGVDMTTATAAEIVVRLPDGTDAVWLADILPGATVTLLVVEHVFAEGDVDVVGAYRAFVAITVPGGKLRSIPISFPVQDRFGERCS